MTGTDVVPTPPPERDSCDPASLATFPVPESLAVAAANIFGVGLGDAGRYAEILCSLGIERGVIGPREAPRIWERHLLNCAAIAAAIPEGRRVVDVGSGAGLPGIPLALARPDLSVTLLDSLSRRIAFLEAVLDVLQLRPRVRTVLARAEEHRVQYEVVTARAVAPLAKLGLWTAGLVPKGGLLVAIRGEQGQAELDAARSALGRTGWKDGHVMKYGDELPTRTTVVVAVRA